MKGKWPHRCTCVSSGRSRLELWSIRDTKQAVSKECGLEPRYAPEKDPSCSRLRGKQVRHASPKKLRGADSIPHLKGPTVPAEQVLSPCPFRGVRGPFGCCPADFLNAPSPGISGFQRVSAFSRKSCPTVSPCPANTSLTVGCRRAERGDA